MLTTNLNFYRVYCDLCPPFPVLQVRVTVTARYRTLSADRASEKLAGCSGSVVVPAFQNIQTVSATTEALHPIQEVTLIGRSLEAKYEGLDFSHFVCDQAGYVPSRIDDQSVVCRGYPQPITMVSSSFDVLCAIHSATPLVLYN